MKILICLLATACICNATLLNLIGDKWGGIADDSDVSYRVVQAPSRGRVISHASSYSPHDHGRYQSQGFVSSPEIINVILDEGYSAAHAHVPGSSGYRYGSSGYGNGDEAQIFNVISQNTAATVPVHIDHGYSASANQGFSSGPSYASSFGHGGSASFSSQFNAILPQILGLILDDNAGHGGSNYGAGGGLNPHLISHFGRSGRVFITHSDIKPNSYFSSGHVIEKGVLKIMRVKGAADGFSPRGPPVHGHPPHGHGW